MFSNIRYKNIQQFFWYFRSFSLDLPCITVPINQKKFCINVEMQDKRFLGEIFLITLPS